MYMLSTLKTEISKAVRCRLRLLLRGLARRGRRRPLLPAASSLRPSRRRSAAAAALHVVLCREAERGHHGLEARPHRLQQVVEALVLTVGFGVFRGVEGCRVKGEVQVEGKGIDSNSRGCAVLKRKVAATRHSLPRPPAPAGRTGGTPPAAPRAPRCRALRAGALRRAAACPASATRERSRRSGRPRGLRGVCMGCVHACG
jgi:hypothetical protein